MTTTYEDRQTGETEPFECRTHGPYIATFTRSETSWIPSWWTNCPACNTEWDREDRERLEAAFGEESREAVEGRIRMAVMRAGVGREHADCTLDSFRTPWKAMHRVRSSAVEYAQTFHSRGLRDGVSLILLGTIGTGKTHLGAALVRSVLASGGTARYLRQSDMVAEIQGSYGAPGASATAKIMASLVEPDLLVVDEVGRARDSEDANKLFADVVDDRNRHGKPMVVISNMTPAEFKKWAGPATYDRLTQRGGCTLCATWPSMRQARYEGEDDE